MRMYGIEITGFEEWSVFTSYLAVMITNNWRISLYAHTNNKTTLTFSRLWQFIHYQLIATFLSFISSFLVLVVFISLLLLISWGYNFNTTITLVFIIYMESRGKIVFALFYHSIAIYQNVWAGKNNVKMKMNKMGYEMNNNNKPCLCLVVSKENELKN